MVQKVLLQIEIDDAALDAAQAKADKLEFTLKKIQERLDMLAGVDPKAPENEARRKLIRWLDGLDKIVSQAKEKPPEGGDIRKLWKEAFEKGLVAIPPPEQPSAKEKPPEGGNACSGKGVFDPELLRKAQERVDARKRGSDDSVDVLCATLDKVIRGVARDIFKPPN